MTHRLSSASLVVVAFACLVSACALGSKSARLSQAYADVLPARPGDKVHALIVEASAAKVVSIWELCQAHIGTESTCQVKHGLKLAIGPDSVVMAEGARAPNWDPLLWELYLDDHPIDLASFDTFHFVRFSKGFSGHTEVATIHQAWNVAIAPPAGQHTLRTVRRLDRPADSALEPGRAPRTWMLSFAVGE